MSAHKTSTTTTGSSPPPDADASHGEGLSEPGSKDLLAALDELNQREVQMLDTITERMRACVKDMKTHYECLSNKSGPTGHRSAQDNDHIQRYNEMAALGHALAGLVRAEQSLRTLLLQAVPREGNVWQQRAAEAQERKTAAFREEFRRSVSVMREEFGPLRTALTFRSLGRVGDRAESEAEEGGIARD